MRVLNKKLNSSKVLNCYSVSRVNDTLRENPREVIFANLWNFANYRCGSQVFKKLTPENKQIQTHTKRTTNYKQNKYLQLSKFKTEHCSAMQFFSNNRNISNSVGFWKKYPSIPSADLTHISKYTKRQCWLLTTEYLPVAQTSTLSFFMQSNFIRLTRKF